MRTKAFSLGGLQKGLPGEPCKAVHRCDSDLIPRTAWADFPSNTSICLGQELPSAGLNLSSPPGQQLWDLGNVILPLSTPQISSASYENRSPERALTQGLVPIEH